ncbi:MAG: thiol:disulfide interchange protein DsbG [Proteobacteria bacterium]|nr:MAG: thiol:disulfide interchange protein DsbG [Pseudomonadota bacterium]
MQMRTMYFHVLASALLATTGAGAAEPSTVERPAVIEQLEQQGFEFMGEFAAPGGLRGFAALAQGRPIAVYLTPDGGHAVIGTLVDAQGEDVSASVLERMVVQPMSQKLWKQLEATSWVADGAADAPRVVYAFMDPNCPYCHRFWQASRRWVQSGKVQLRHILVGLIREDSANKAAAILAAPSPTEAFTLNETRFDQGGISGLESIPQTVRAQLDAHERLMSEIGLQGTPGILFQDEAGVVRLLSGMPAPEDMEHVLGPR